MEGLAAWTLPRFGSLLYAMGVHVSFMFALLFLWRGRLLHGFTLLVLLAKLPCQCCHKVLSQPLRMVKHPADSQACFQHNAHFQAVCNTIQMPGVYFDAMPGVSMTHCRFTGYF